MLPRYKTGNYFLRLTVICFIIFESDVIILCRSKSWLIQRRKKMCEVHVCGNKFQAAVSSIWARNSVNTAQSQRYFFKVSLSKLKQNVGIIYNNRYIPENHLYIFTYQEII